ncbi:MAG: class I SAM-dependent methyltransferase, partial [Patescibacteria group bacterium]|nr:class I SAM-dependent methyltransferase [Patescibacteria group bacterium]
GVFVLHTICRNRREPPDRFVRKHIFPGFELPTFTDIIGQTARAGFRLWHAENLQDHYAKTLLCWLERLRKNRGRIVHTYGERRYRLFEVYLAGGAASFSVQGGMQLGQFVFTTERRNWAFSPAAVMTRLSENS